MRTTFPKEIDTFDGLDTDPTQTPPQFDENEVGK
jgi:hypothetical protein